MSKVSWIKLQEKQLIRDWNNIVYDEMLGYLTFSTSDQTYVPYGGDGNTSNYHSSCIPEEFIATQLVTKDMLM